MEPECKHCGSTDGTCYWAFDRNEDYAPCGAIAEDDDD